RLIRPVVRVTDRVARTMRHRRPGAPKEERCEIPQSRRIAHRAGWNRIVGLAFAKDLRVMRQIRLERVGPNWRYRHRARFWIKSVLTHHPREPTDQLRALFLIKFIKGTLEIRFRPPL